MPQDGPHPVNSSARLQFDAIAPTYDLLNHVLSLGWDFAWRRYVARRLGRERPQRIVDLATGTGDLAIALPRHGCDCGEIVALDISEPMLAIGRRKVERAGFSDRIRLVRDDAMQTSLPAGSFDAATMAFGIRNTPDVAKTLDEIFRLLRPAGVAVILEFSLPPNLAIRGLYLAYLRFVVPLVGGLISGNRQAYRYLDTSIEAFYRPAEFCRLMEQAGFANVEAIPLTLGVASMYCGSKP